MIEIQRSLTGKTKESSSKSKSEETNNLDPESIEEISNNVEKNWKIAKDGEITKSKNKWFKSEGLKTFPKKALYLSVENPEPVNHLKTPKKQKQAKVKED